MAMANDKYKDATLPWTVDGGLVPTYCLVVRYSRNLNTTRSRLVSPCCSLTRPTPHLSSPRSQKHLQHFGFDNTVSMIHTSCRSESSKYKLGRFRQMLNGCSENLYLSYMSGVLRLTICPVHRSSFMWSIARDKMVLFINKDNSIK